MRPLTGRRQDKCCPCKWRAGRIVVTLGRPLPGWSSMLFVALYRSLFHTVVRILQFKSLAMIHRPWPAWKRPMACSLWFRVSWIILAAFRKQITAGRYILGATYPIESSYCTCTMLYIKVHSQAITCSWKVSEFEPYMQSLYFQKGVLLLDSNLNIVFATNLCDISFIVQYISFVAVHTLHSSFAKSVRQVSLSVSVSLPLIITCYHWVNPNTWSSRLKWKAWTICVSFIRQQQHNSSSFDNKKYTNI